MWERLAGQLLLIQFGFTCILWCSSATFPLPEQSEGLEGQESLSYSYVKSSPPALVLLLLLLLRLAVQVTPYPNPRGATSFGWLGSCQEGQEMLSSLREPQCMAGRQTAATSAAAKEQAEEQHCARAGPHVPHIHQGCLEGKKAKLALN